MRAKLFWENIGTGIDMLLNLLFGFSRIFAFG